MLQTFKMLACDSGFTQHLVQCNKKTQNALGYCGAEKKRQTYSHVTGSHVTDPLPEIADNSAAGCVVSDGKQLTYLVCPIQIKIAFEPAKLHSRLSLVETRMNPQSGENGCASQLNLTVAKLKTQNL